MPSINSARYAQRIIQTENHESPSFLRKVHRLDPPVGGSGLSAPPDDVDPMTSRPTFPPTNPKTNPNPIWGAVHLGRSDQFPSGVGRWRPVFQDACDLGPR